MSGYRSLTQRFYNLQRVFDPIHLSHPQLIISRFNLHDFRYKFAGCALEVFILKVNLHVNEQCFLLLLF